MTVTAARTRRPPLQPATDCETCAWLEMTSRERVRWTFRKLFVPPTPYEVAAAQERARASLLQALAGNRPVGWYERHRARWIESGDLMELDRMRRHITREGQK